MATLLTQTYNLNLIPGQNIVVVNVSAYDNSPRVIKFNMYNGPAAIDVSAWSARVEGTRQGTSAGFSKSCTVSGSTVRFSLTNAMTKTSGKHPAAIVFYQNNTRVASANFILNVSPIVLEESISPTEEDETIYQQWIASSTAQLQENTTDIVALKATTETNTSDIATLRDRLDACVTPQMYGAKGDGSTDDTDSIQQCIDDCYANGIYRIFFPRGVYRITRPLVIYFSYTDFWFGKGITLEGEHKGDTIIVKSGTAKYNNVDTVLYCATGESGHNDGTACIVKNFTLKNESTASESYVINGDNYSRGRFENLTVIGNYGIFCAGGYSNIFNDIIGQTTETFFKDGGTSTLVGKLGCFGAHNPYVLRSIYSTYDVLFGDGCSGTFVDVAPYGNCHINSIGTESPVLDCVVSAGADGSTGQARAITIDNIFCFNLTTAGAKYLSLKNGRLRVGALTIEYQRTPVQNYICFFTNTYGSCHIGDIGHISNAANYDKDLVELVGYASGVTFARNHLYIDNSEVAGYYTDGLVSVGGNSSGVGVGESNKKNKFQSVVMGGYFRHSLQYGEYFRPGGTTQRYNVMPPCGSLILNDLTNANSNIGAAGFISLASTDNELYGNLISNKAPIPIMFCTSEANVPSAALKNGTLLFNTSTSKLEVYYNNAWVVVGS